MGLMCIGPSCYTVSLQWDEIIKTNLRVVGVVTISEVLVAEKIRDLQYDSSWKNRFLKYI